MRDQDLDLDCKVGIIFSTHIQAVVHTHTHSFKENSWKELAWSDVLQGQREGELLLLPEQFCGFTFYQIVY